MKDVRVGSWFDVMAGLEANGKTQPGLSLL
jgi:hypothetical protein